MTGSTSTVSCTGTYFNSNTADDTQSNDVYIDDGALSTADCPRGDGSEGTLDVSDGGTSVSTYHNYDCRDVVPSPQPTMSPQVIDPADFCE